MDGVAIMIQCTCFRCPLILPLVVVLKSARFRISEPVCRSNAEFYDCPNVQQSLAVHHVKIRAWFVKTVDDLFSSFDLECRELAGKTELPVQGTKPTIRLISLVCAWSSPKSLSESCHHRNLCDLMLTNKVNPVYSPDKICRCANILTWKTFSLFEGFQKNSDRICPSQSSLVGNLFVHELTDEVLIVGMHGDCILDILLEYCAYPDQQYVWYVRRCLTPKLWNLCHHSYSQICLICHLRPQL